MTSIEPHDVRDRIIAAAATLVRTHGPEAATTRAVATAASVQPPTIYRLIGDKDALLDAVAEFELAAYIATKKNHAVHPDPVEALRLGWDKHAAFGLANPGLFRIMSSNANAPAAAAGLRMLAQRIHLIAQAGRLNCSEERAVAIVHAACVGAVLAVLAQHGTTADFDLCTETRDAIIRAITTQPVDLAAPGIGSAASALRARLGQSNALTPGERGLMDELLLRLGNER